MPRNTTFNLFAPASALTNHLRTDDSSFAIQLLPQQTGVSQTPIVVANAMYSDLLPLFITKSQRRIAAFGFEC
jgi:hypothetical protein